jgi:hypothetical protein
MSAAVVPSSTLTVRPYLAPAAALAHLRIGAGDIKNSLQEVANCPDSANDADDRCLRIDRQGAWRVDIAQAHVMAYERVAASRAPLSLRIVPKFVRRHARPGGKNEVRSA